MVPPSRRATCHHVSLRARPRVPYLFRTRQVEGKDALRALYGKVQTSGPGVMYHGALAASAATFVGHYPWFATVSRQTGRGNGVLLVMPTPGWSLVECW